MTRPLRAVDDRPGIRCRVCQDVPWNLVLDDGDRSIDVPDALFLVSFDRGEQPWSAAGTVHRRHAEATLLPTGGLITRRATAEGRTVTLVEGDGWTAKVDLWAEGGSVTVTATTQELAETVLKDAVDGASQPVVQNDSVTLGFWYHTARGALRRERDITASGWADVRRHYPTAVTAGVDRLMGVEPTTLTGRIVLLHGPPGTGKTSLIRSLARQWLPWCQVDYVLDPETLFANPSYLMDVVIGAEDDDERWRLLVLEDCDELIGPTAKSSSGQAVSRLLNLTDGILGQGRRVLVALTTNEPLNRLHPAVARPGRCLAEIEIGPLPPAEALVWLGREAPDVVSGGAPITTPATLAELIALRDGAARPLQDAPTGLYL